MSEPKCPFCGHESRYVSTNNSANGQPQTTFYTCTQEHHWSQNHQETRNA